MAIVISSALKSRFWRDVGWQASGNLVAQAIAVACMPFLTRLYAPADFALQSLFIQILGFTCIVQTMRLEYFVQLPKDDSEAEAVVGLVVAIGLGMAFGMVAISAIWGNEIAGALGEPGIARWLVWAPVTGLVCGVALALEHFRQRQGNFRLSGQAEIVNKAAYLGTALTGSLQAGAGGLILATGFGAIGKALMLALSVAPADRVKSLRALRFPAWRVASSVFFRYASLSRTTVVSHLLQNLAGVIPILCISWRYGADNLGQFALVNSTIALPVALFGASIGKVYYQRAAAAWVNEESIKELWSSTFRKLALLGLPLFTCIALVSPWAYPLVFGSNWELAGIIATSMAVPSAASFLSSPMDRGSIIAGASRYILTWNTGRVIGATVVALVSLGLNLEFRAFVGLHCAQMTVIYLVDLAYNRHLAHRGPLRTQECR